MAECIKKCNGKSVSHIICFRKKSDWVFSFFEADTWKCVYFEWVQIMFPKSRSSWLKFWKFCSHPWYCLRFRNWSLPSLIAAKHGISQFPNTICLTIQNVRGDARWVIPSGDSCMSHENRKTGLLQLRPTGDQSLDCPTTSYGAKCHIQTCHFQGNVFDHELRCL